jgi:hydrogenase maturation factor
MTDCADDRCITCSDEAVPMRVTEVRRDGIALCGDAEVMTDLVGDVAPGDELLVHAGTAIGRAA